MDEQKFVEELKKLSIEVDDKKTEALSKYYELLIEWNKRINLTTIIEKQDVYLKHFYDSLTLSKAIDLDKISSLCDVGTGAGFPGVVIKIFYPEIEVTLIDSLNKRIKFLDKVIEKLNLKKIKTVHTRMEDYSKVNEEIFDIITARAVANTAILGEICSRSLKIGGKLILMKGEVAEELSQSQAHMKKLSYEYKDKIKFKLPIEDSVRNLIIFEKTKETDKKYPRTVEKIKTELNI